MEWWAFWTIIIVALSATIILGIINHMNSKSVFEGSGSGNK